MLHVLLILFCSFVKLNPIPMCVHFHVVALPEGLYTHLFNYILLWLKCSIKQNIFQLRILFIFEKYFIKRIFMFFLLLLIVSLKKIIF